MARPSTPEKVVRQIETLWAENGRPTAEKVETLAELKNIEGRPGLRKIQQIIRRKKQQISSDPPPPEPPIQPWGTDWPESPEDIECLLRVMLSGRLNGVKYLTARQSRWVLRLREIFSVAGLSADAVLERGSYHLIWALLYSRREQGASILKQGTPYTDDLDAVMMFRPWESEGRWEAYQEAIKAGIVPSWHFKAELDVMKLIEPESFDYKWELWEQMIADRSED